MDFLVDCQMAVIAPIPPYGGTDAHPQGHPVISSEANIMFSSVLALTTSVASRNELVSLTPWPLGQQYVPAYVTNVLLTEGCGELGQQSTACLATTGWPNIVLVLIGEWVGTIRCPLIAPQLFPTGLLPNLESTRWAWGELWTNTDRSQLSCDPINSDSQVRPRKLCWMAAAVTQDLPDWDTFKANFIKIQQSSTDEVIKIKKPNSARFWCLSADGCQHIKVSNW